MRLLEALGGALSHPDEREGRIWGILYGKVTDVDSQLFGRVRVRVGSQGDTETTHWCDPGWVGGTEGVPRINDPVYVAFVGGDPNRGVYWWAPTSRTKNRASDAMALGTTLVGLINFLVDQFNQLRSDYNSFITTYNGHTHSFTYSAGPTTGTAGTTVTPSATGSSTAAVAANKGKASDGSVVANQTSSAVVLSGQAKVQK